jgi:pSer/pThr/pTyr-binding forkhead associated (FHA) protein
MQDRYSLRFLGGEREGERVAISAPRFTLGRRPGNSLQLEDASVSGQHAEFTVENGVLVLRDLGSTNGTRVGGRRIEEARPAHGDRLAFGSIEAVLEDAELGGAPAEVDGGEVERVSLEQVARSGKGSKLGLLVGLVVILGGGGAAAFFLTGGGGGQGRRETPALAIEGNRLAGGAFEEGDLDASWGADESAPTLFNPWSGAASTGQGGARASLAAGEWALLRGAPVPVSQGRSLEVGGWLRARGEVAGRIGVAFLRPAGADGAPGLETTAWGAWVREVTGHQEVRLAVDVPPGANRVQVLVEARAAGEPSGDGDGETVGSVDADDAFLLEAGQATGPAARIGEYALHLAGDPPSTVQLTKVNRTLVAQLRAEGADRLRDHPLSATASGGVFRLTPGAAAEAVVLRVEPEQAAAGIATIGAGGLAEHGPDFEAEGVTSVLLGGGYDLVALELGGPARVAARAAEGGSVLLRVEGGGELGLRVGFDEQRTRAGDLAFAARKAEAAGQLGECLALWNDLLREAPYDAELVQEARGTRTRIEQAGLEELARVEADFERATFFRLADLYRQCRRSAAGCGTRYAGSAVESQAAELVARIDGSLAGLEEDLDRDEVRRLRGIHRALAAGGAEDLAGEVERYLAERFGAED